MALPTRPSREGGNLDRGRPDVANDNPAHPEPVEGFPQWGKARMGVMALPTRRSREGGNLDCGRPDVANDNSAHPEPAKEPVIPAKAGIRRYNKEG